MAMTREQERELLTAVGISSGHVHEATDGCFIIEYGGSMTFEILERISFAFGTKLIDLGADHGTGSDPSFDPFVRIHAPLPADWREKIWRGGR